MQHLGKGEEDAKGGRAVDHEALAQAHVNVITGACMAIGLKVTHILSIHAPWHLFRNFYGSSPAVAPIMQASRMIHGYVEPDTCGVVSAAEASDGAIAARWDGQCCSAGGALGLHSVSAGGQECCSRLPVRRGLNLALLLCHLTRAHTGTHAKTCQQGEHAGA